MERHSQLREAPCVRKLVFSACQQTDEQAGLLFLFRTVARGLTPKKKGSTLASIGALLSDEIDKYAEEVDEAITQEESLWTI